MHNEVLAKAQIALKNAFQRATRGRSQIEEVQFHVNGYAEPGYTDPESGVIATGNWNDFKVYDGKTFITLDSTPSDLSEELEAMGVELEWSDEWEPCGNCNKLIRTQENSYHWRPSYWGHEEGFTCIECVKNDPAAYIEWHAEWHKGITMDIDPGKHGYTQLEGRLENGLHGGQAADPDKIRDILIARKVERFLFTLDSKSQFDIRFSVWVADDELDKAGRLTEREKNGTDPAEMLKEGLRSAAIAPKTGSGIQITTINSDGTATTRTVSPEEFVSGKAMR